jgi:hypothetical protein
VQRYSPLQNVQPGSRTTSFLPSGYEITLPGVKGHGHDEVGHSTVPSAGDKVLGPVLELRHVSS